MSKSLGNVVDPMEIVDRYGLDQMRYFLFREVKFGEDGDFSEAALKRRISFDLANDLGNLVQRILVFIQKIGGSVTVDYNFSDYEAGLFERARSLIDRIRPLMDRQDLYGSLNTAWELVAESNKFINDARPWELVKRDTDKLNKVLTVLCESIRSIGFGLAPFLPETSRKIFDFMKVSGKSFEEIKINFENQTFGESFPLFPKEA
jgi:methionyl-tRNA synthetase